MIRMVRMFRTAAATLLVATAATTAAAQDYATASAINNRGQIAGGTTTTGPGPMFVTVVSGQKSVNTFGTFGGPASLAFAINDNGDVVGQSDTSVLEANGQEFISRAFAVVRGEMADLGTLPGFSNSQAYAVNNQGTVVGWSYNQSPAGPFTLPTFRAFVLDLKGPGGGVMRDIGTLGGATAVAFGINDSGRVVGRSRTAGGQDHAFVYADGAMIDLGTLGGTQSEARAINTAGQIVGLARTASGARRAFLYGNGVMLNLGSLGGPVSRANAINNRGEVAGQSLNQFGEMRAFLWRDGVMIDLGTLGGVNAVAYGINERGEVVGESETADGEVHAFIWRKGVMTDLGFGK